MVSGSADVEFEVVADPLRGCVKVKWEALSCCGQLTADLQPVTVQRGTVGHEADVWVVLDVEETRRAQVLVAVWNSTLGRAGSIRQRVFSML
jgi:hypothetical protein